MGRIDYDQGKLLKAAALGAAGALLFICVMANPEWFSASRRGRWFTSGFGLTVMVPLMTAFCLFLLYRSVLIAFGNPVAIEFTPSHLNLNGYWGISRVRWSDVVLANLESNMGRPQLRVKTRGGLMGGKSVRLPLGLTALNPPQIVQLIAAIEGRAGSPGVAAPAFPVAETAEPAFDPDDAIARYLARKARGEVGEDMAPAGAAAGVGPARPARPAFGRKQA